MLQIQAVNTGHPTVFVLTRLRVEVCGLCRFISREENIASHRESLSICYDDKTICAADSFYVLRIVLIELFVGRLDVGLKYLKYLLTTVLIHY